MKEEEIKQRNESKEFLKDLQYYLFQNKRSPKIDKLSALLDSDEKRIETLEKENAELKEFRQDCVKLTEDNVVMARQRAEIAKQLTKAKELIKELLLNYTYVMKFHKYKNRDLIERAEDFLKGE